MFISKKALAFLVIAASGAQGYNVQTPPKANRRAMLQKAGTTGAAFLAVASGLVNPDPSFAMDTNMNRMDTRDVTMNRSFQQNNSQKNFLNQGTNAMNDKSMGQMSLAKVSEWPESQYLVPFSEMEQSLDALKKQVDLGQVTNAKKMADTFVSKNTKAYKVAASNYAKNINYANPTDMKARQDQQFYLDAADDTVTAIKEVQGKLQKLSKKGETRMTPDVLASINRAQNGVQKIMNAVPRGDVDAARSYARSVASTDGNRWFEGDQSKFMSKNGQFVAKNGQSSFYGTNNKNFNQKNMMKNKDGGMNLAYNSGGGFNTENSFDRKNFNNNNNFDQQNKNMMKKDGGRNLAYNSGGGFNTENSFDRKNFNNNNNNFDQQNKNMKKDGGRNLAYNSGGGLNTENSFDRKNFNNNNKMGKDDKTLAYNKQGVDSSSSSTGYDDNKYTNGDFKYDF